VAIDGDVSDAAAARCADRSFLGLDMQDGGDHGRARITDRLLTPDGRLYGGGGVSLAAAAMEAATGRRLRWVTTQFVSSAGAGDHIDIAVEIGAMGHVTAQALVVARVGDRTLFNAMGSTDDATTELPDVSFASMPEVPKPDLCPELRLPIPPGSGRGHFVTSDLRDAGPTERPSMLAWARVRDHDASRPAILGFVADYIPVAAMRAIGMRGAGASLDNTIRVGAPPARPSPWVLVELVPELVAGGYGHGTAILWSETGEQLGIASQTARLRPMRL
jgi:acyl-CoA thioesterase